ncbi:MAG: formylglycine-generating enzyme family protein [Symploca sp. SIO2E9]|nr:formylglycine-generating enzyme family protein [Symploca sp. SIO2E9]
MVKTGIKYTQGKAQYYIEKLGNQVELEMVLIKEGTFAMGAPETEEGSRDSERPQHQVTVPSFFMGKYPITQAQWKAVASLEKVNRDLKLEPSRLKGDNLPVEQVSWYDAVEFCSRLCKYTNRAYRLPSEAEWEYACRAGTTTPFHFGDTITTDLANYRGTDDEELGWSASYGRGPKGIYREETTAVGSFDVANAFGLYDMHGNVWEWCQDDWHKNYEGAPTYGSAWLDKNNNPSQREGSAVLRGGSWFDFPRLCRSAFRFSYDRAERDIIINSFGFRVVCGFGRSLR